MTDIRLKFAPPCIMFINENVLNGVYFNTDVEHGYLGKPLGEWP